MTDTYSTMPDDETAEGPQPEQEEAAEPAEPAEQSQQEANYREGNPAAQLRPVRPFRQQGP